ncbi:MAG TPA: uroporphyrinogen decarboxylase [Thermoanaerobaculia bacterium]|nr:uroporphyrinogen decarboxylase [Thermoanaerobaculia bacterium]
MSTSSPSAQRLLDACFGRPVDRTPVWMMRQAGRYLPEYRDVRRKVSFLELCRTPELAVEVSLQPFRRFQPDGVIFFSDILVPVAAMGARVEFGDAGPDLPEPVRTLADVNRLHTFDPSAAIGFTGEILATLAREVGSRAAVLGFAGAPWTLASYLVEGGGSKSFAVIKQMMGRDPGTLKRLLDLLADAVADTLSFQLASGAQAVQLFDTWAGELSLEDYRRWALPATVRTIGRIRRPHPAPSFAKASEGVPLPPSSSEARRAKEEGKGEDGGPVILFVNGCGHLLEAMAESGADVLSIDWRVALSEARRRVPRLALQGNLDPGVLLGQPDEVARRTRALIGETAGRAHVVNLGHGVLPQTPVECAQAFFDAARELAGASLAPVAEARA